MTGVPPAAPLAPAASPPASPPSSDAAAGRLALASDPGAICAFNAASSASTWPGLGGGVELLLDVVTTAPEHVGKRTGVDQLVDGAGARLHLGDLVLGAVERHAGVAHRLRDPRHGFADARLGLGGGVGGLERLLLGAEGIDLGLEPAGGGLELAAAASRPAGAGCPGSRAARRASRGGRGPRGPGPPGPGRAPAWPGPGASGPGPGAGWPGARGACWAVATSARARRTFCRFSTCFS